MSLHIDPIEDKIRDLIIAGRSSISSEDPTAIKSFHFGDPIFLPKSDLPALIIQTDNTRVVDVTNAEDEHRITIMLTLVTDIRNFFNDGDNVLENIHYGYQAAKKIMEGRQADYSLEATSLLSILRAGADLGNNAHIDVSIEQIVDYGFTVGLRGEKTWAWETNLSIPVYFSHER